MKRLLLLLCLLPGLAFALTTEQNAALKTAVLAEPSIAACVTEGNDGCVADWLNATSTFVVYRTRVTQEEYQTATSPTATQFDWAGTGGFISRSQGERDAWRTMFASGGVNPSNTNVRAAFSDIFNGTGAGAVNNRAHLLSLSKRFARNAEKVLATGTGTDASPATLTFEGKINSGEIYLIMGR